MDRVSRIKKYASKSENYDIATRIEDLKSVVQTQCDQDLRSEYMRGMANGLLLAWTIVHEPYGAEVPYFDEMI